MLPEMSKSSLIMPLARGCENCHLLLVFTIDMKILKATLESKLGSGRSPSRPPLRFPLAISISWPSQESDSGLPWFCGMGSPKRPGGSLVFEINAIVVSVRVKE